MIATQERVRPVRHTIQSSTRLRALLAGAVAAAALAAAFPKVGFAWIAPFALAGLFWSWFATSSRSALMNGFVAGLVYFAIMFSWFAVTAAALVGPFGFVTVAGPAVIDGTPFAIGAFLASYVYARAPGILGPLGAAAAFTICDWIRSVGWFGAPFAQVGYSQVDGPFAALAAYGGSYFVTFVLAAIGATLAAALIDRTRVRDAVVTIGTVIVVSAIAYAAWPARSLAPATIPVAAIQGNIKQDIKWNPNTILISLRRYMDLTATTAAAKPQMVLWPETVITVKLGDDDHLPPDIVAETQRVRAAFGALAHRLNTTLVVGALEDSNDGLHNALYIFGPDGKLQTIYRKRQLVPFAESFPARTMMGWLPYIDEFGTQTPGHDPTVFKAGDLSVAPMICWESAFSDVIQDQLDRGAGMLAIATDDAWFGESAGPYQHAQIAQMRAIETGRWVLRAAATGVSGIIAPDGRWTVRANLDTQAVVIGNVGAAVPTVFSHIGPTPVVAAFALLYVLSLLAGRPWSMRRA